jgi:hypothetical protein
MKRSVLVSWASDACAIGYNPALRATAGNVVNYDDIDALQSLDAGQSADTVTYAFKRLAAAQTMERLERPRT